MDTQPADVPAADALVAGPPCPPWSRMGLAASWRDPRAKAFLHILTWIVSLAKRGLKFFVLENVKGMADRRKGDRERPLDRILKILRRGLPENWSIQTVISNSCVTAQSRERVYLIGSRRSVPDISIALERLPRAEVKNVLLLSSSVKKAHHLKDTHKANLERYMQLLRPKLIDAQYSGEIAIFEIDRNPKAHQRWQLRTDGLTPCLRTRGDLWVVSLGDAQPAISRMLCPAERCLLQGISPKSLPRKGISDRDVVIGCANAMTVPVVGTILSAALSAW